MMKIKRRLYRCCSNCNLWKLIVDNGLEDLWRRENPDSPEFTCYDTPFAKDSGYTGSILISILIQKLLTILKINHIMVSFTDQYNSISIDRLPTIEKLKLEKIRDTLIILFYVSPRSLQLKRLLSKT